jgi:hypothetical protein
MEEFDRRLGSLNVRKVVERAGTMGCVVDWEEVPEVLRVRECLAETLAVLTAFVAQSSDQSLEHFLGDFLVGGSMRATARADCASRVKEGSRKNMHAAGVLTLATLFGISGTYDDLDVVLRGPEP